MNLPTESPGSGDPANGEGRPPVRLGDLQKTITMAQIAKAAGVSQGAISSLLNDRDYGIRVSEKTRERVFKVCREMGYLPNDLRAVVRMYPELGEFALLIPVRYAEGLAHPFVARVAAAAMAAVPEPSRSLALAIYDEAADYLEKPDLLPHPVAVGTVSKFLFLGAPSTSLVQTITKRGSPLVVLGHDVPQPGVHSILPDLVAASRLALEHFAQHGHSHVAIISGAFGSNDPAILALHHGVRLACEQLNLSIDPGHIVHGELTAEAGARGLDALLARAPIPTAIFCLCDALAAGVLARAHARGCRVPDQLSVIGCGDDACAAMSSPPLTAVHLPFEEMAALGVREVDQLLRGGGLDEARHTILPVRLVLRSSTAARATRPFTP